MRVSQGPPPAPVMRMGLLAVLLAAAYYGLDELAWWTGRNPRTLTKLVLAALGVAVLWRPALRLVPIERARPRQRWVACATVAVALVMLALPPWERQTGGFLGLRPWYSPPSYQRQLSFGEVVQEGRIARVVLYAELAALLAVAVIGYRAAGVAGTDARRRGAGDQPSASRRGRATQ